MGIVVRVVVWAVVVVVLVLVGVLVLVVWCFCFIYGQAEGWQGWRRIRRFGQQQRIAS